MATEILDENVEVVPTEQNSGEPKKKKITWADIAAKLRGRKHKKQNPDASVPEAESVGGTVESEDFVGAGGPSVDFETTDFESADEESGNSKNKPGFVARLREKRQKRKEKREAKKAERKKRKQKPVAEEEVPADVVETVEQLGGESNNNPVDQDPIIVKPIDTSNDEQHVGSGGEARPVEENHEDVDNKTRSGKAGWIVGGTAVVLIAAGVVVFGGKRLNNRSNANENQQPVTPVVPVDTIPAPVPVDTVPVVDTNNVQPVVNPNKPPKLVRRDPTIWQPGDPKPAHIKRRAIYNGR